MKTLLLFAIGVGACFAGCGGDSDRGEGDAPVAQLRAQRDELQQLNAKLLEERQKLYRSIADIQSRVEDLDLTLTRASAEIWGDGSSTGAQLSTARRTLGSIRAEVEVLAERLRPSK